MISILSNLVQKCFVSFMDNFSIHKDCFDNYLTNLGKMLKRCWDKHLNINWKKCHVMVKSGIVLGHIISNNGIEVENAKVDLIINLPIPTYVKDICSFLGHADFY